MLCLHFCSNNSMELCSDYPCMPPELINPYASFAMGDNDEYESMNPDTTHGWSQHMRNTIRLVLSCPPRNYDVMVMEVVCPCRCDYDMIWWRWWWLWWNDRWWKMRINNIATRFLSWETKYLISSIGWCSHSYGNQHSTLRNKITCIVLLDMLWHLFSDIFSVIIQHFYLSPVFGLQVLLLPASVCVCVNHKLICVIAHHPFKLEPPNWDNRCNTP